LQPRHLNLGGKSGGKKSGSGATMFLTHRQYIRFLRGGMMRVAVVAFLPGELAARMPTLSTDVRIDRDYARKIWERHRLGHEDLGLIQPIIDHGWCTKSRQNALDFIFVTEAPNLGPEGNQAGP
jgi:hypothetical protein